MKAIVQDRYGEADVLQLRDVEVPEIGRREVLISVRAAGVDPSAWHLMTGLPYAARLAFGLRTPRQPILGGDLAGLVEAVGPDVTGFRPGDEVFGTGVGAFAEYAKARPDKLAPKPANLTFEQAATVPVSGVTALQALRNAGRLRPGQKVLIVGAGGGVGTFAVQLAVAMGAEVTGVCSTGKVDLVRSLGAAEVIDYTRTGIAGRFDLIIDIAGNRPLAVLRAALTPKGTIVFVGGEDGGKVLGMGRQLRAGLLGPFTGQRFVTLLARSASVDLITLRDYIEAGSVTPIVDRTFTLAQAPDALRYIGTNHSRGKAVITIAAG